MNSDTISSQVEDTSGEGQVRFSSDLGVGKPLEVDDRRDFTVKALRRPAPAPPFSTEALTAQDAVPFPSSTTATQLVRSNSTPVSSPSRHQHSHSTSSIPSTPSRRSYHKHSSSTSSLHAPIPDPTYVRSQPIGLQRSSSFAEVPMSPTLSGGLTRKLSVSSLDDSEDEDETRRVMERPLKHRSESLPSFPPPEVLKQRKVAEDLSELPVDPKKWRPSQLATYIAARFPSGLPSRVEEDMTNFIRTSGINGHIFMRLRDGDMEEMGINVRWRGLFNEIREKLRKEALSGRIWGFEGARAEEETQEVEGGQVGHLRVASYVSESEDDLAKEEWKQSWRFLQGNKPSGRVKGMAQAYKAPGPLEEEERKSRSPQKSRFAFPNSPYPRHFRSDSIESNTSTASIDSGSSQSGRAMSPFDFDVDTTSPASSPVADKIARFSSPPRSYQSHIASHIQEEIQPYGLVRRPSQRTGKSSIKVGKPSPRLALPEPPSDQSENENDEGDKTVKTSLKGSQKSSALADLFGIDISTPEKRRMEGSRTSEEMEREIEEAETKSGDLMVVHVGDRKGSMVLVKKSQLEDLKKRLNEVEDQLSIALSTNGSRPLSPSCDEDSIPHYRHKNPTSVGGWVLDSLAAVTDAPPSPSDPYHDRFQGPLSWTALGGYMLAASVGVGIVAGEVVVSKLFGVRRR